MGVGGSGKQSLARLAANISGLEVFQLQLTTGYGVNELKGDLALLYMKAGRNFGVVVVVPLLLLLLSRYCCFCFCSVVVVVVPLLLLLLLLVTT